MSVYDRVSGGEENRNSKDVEFIESQLTCSSG